MKLGKRNLENNFAEWWLRSEYNHGVLVGCVYDYGYISSGYYRNNRTIGIAPCFVI